jgi:uncharacterized delta-60 repeat protein
MTRTAYFPAIVFFILFLSIGCSGGGKNQVPVVPDTGLDVTGVPSFMDEGPGHRYMLGLMEVYIDPASNTADYVPLRSASFHCNIIEFFTVFGGMDISLPYQNYTTGEFTLDFTMSHPIPDSIYTVFDMRGIIFGTGSTVLTSKDDPDLKYLGQDGFQILNPDGWTRWWNPNEFPNQMLLGYRDAFATPGFTTTATLHSYKYFATDLGLDADVADAVNISNRGAFLTNTGTTASRRFKIKFTVKNGSPVFKFAMAFDCCWDEPTGGGAIPGIENFPPEANCPEAYHVKVDSTASTAYYNGPGNSGGNLQLKIEVFDWGAPDNPNGIDGEIAAIQIESPTLFDNILNLTIASEPGSSPTSGIYQITIPNVHPTGLYNQSVMVEVKSSIPSTYAPPVPGIDYPDADLAAYAIATIPVKKYEPVIQGSYNTNGMVVDIKTLGHFSYAIDTVDGLVIADVTNPDDPVVINNVILPYIPTALDVENGYAYIIDTANNFRVIDIDPVGAASEVHAINITDLPLSIDLAGSYAYVGGALGTLYMINITDPETVYIENSAGGAGSGPINGVAVMGGYAYTARDDFEIFDVDPPASLSSLLVVPTASTLNNVDVTDFGYAFAGDSSNQLVILDIDPQWLANEVETFDAGGLVNDVQADSDTAYITVEVQGLQIVSYDEATATAYLVAKLDIANAEKISVEGNMAYIDGEVTLIELWKDDDSPDEESGNLIWAKSARGADYSYAYDITSLSDNSTVAVGMFIGSATFGPGEPSETVLTSAGGQDCFISRYNPDGSLAWAKSAGGVSPDTCMGITTLSDNSTVVTGGFGDSAIFGSGEPNETVLTSAGYEDIFIACYNPDGTLAWAKSAGGADSTFGDYGHAITTLSDNSTVVTGLFWGPATFGPGEPNQTVLTSAGVDIFLARYNPDGTLVWAKSAGGAGSLSFSFGITTLSDNSTVVTGSFEDSVTFGLGEPNQTVLPCDGDWADIFIACYNPDGTLSWAKRAGGVDYDEGYGITTLSDNSTVVTGFFSDSATFGSGEPNQTDLITGDNCKNIFIARYNPDGTLVWAKSAGGISGFCDMGFGITTLADNSTVVTGQFFGLAVFGLGELNQMVLTSAGSYDIFIARYNPNGTLAWAKSAGGASDEWANGITTLSDNTTVVAGQFRESATFGPGEPNQTVLTFDGCYDIFVARFNE